MASPTPKVNANVAEFASQSETRLLRARLLAAGIVSEYRAATAADKTEISSIVSELTVLTTEPE